MKKIGWRKELVHVYRDEQDYVRAIVVSNPHARGYHEWFASNSVSDGLADTVKGAKEKSLQTYRNA